MDLPIHAFMTIDDTPRMFGVLCVVQPPTGNTEFPLDLPVGELTHFTMSFTRNAEDAIRLQSGQLFLAGHEYPDVRNFASIYEMIDILTVHFSNTETPNVRYNTASIVLIHNYTLSRFEYDLNFKREPLEAFIDDLKEQLDSLYSATCVSGLDTCPLLK